MRFVSLGPTCETRWQLDRLLGEEPAREAFDWQITDFAALMFCLHANFRGAFERDNLCIKYGCVRDRRFEAVYPHAFGYEPVAPDAIEAHYEHERQAFDRRVERFRDALGAPGPVVCVRRERLSPASIRSLEGALRRLARRQIHLWVLGDHVSAHRLPGNVDAMQFRSRFSYEERWQGDDEAWDAAFSAGVQRLNRNDSCGDARAA